MNKNKLLEYIFTDNEIHKAIKSIVDTMYHEDMKTHLIEQLIKIDEDKLLKLYNDKELIYFCIKIIKNQYESSTSTFYKIYRNKGQTKLFRTYNFTTSENLLDETEEYIDSPTPKETLNKLKLLLLNQYEDFLTNQYHKTLFELYYFKKLKLREIQDKTGIDYRTISRSIRKTKAWLKNELKDYGYF